MKWIYIQWILIQYRFFGHAWLCWKLPTLPKFSLYTILKTAGANLGKQIHFNQGLFIDNTYGNSNSPNDFSNLEIQDDVYLGANVYLDLSNHILIGKSAVISNHCKILTHQSAGDRELHRITEKSEPVQIGAHAFLGTDSVILCGTKVKDGEIIPAKNVVRSSS